MGRFVIDIGYGESVENPPNSGVWDDVITEKTYFADLVRNVRSFEEKDQIQKHISVSNSLSIVADQYANEHFFAIRYIRWAQALWTVSEVEVQSPRLLLKLGEVYHGPIAD